MTMKKRAACRRDSYTTGDVARICQVAPKTATKWFDKGLLKGYKIPGSQDRRIRHADLMDFLHAHNIPSALAPASVLLVGPDKDVGKLLPADHVWCPSPFEVGLHFYPEPHAIVIDSAIGSAAIGDLVKRVREASLTCRMVLLLCEGETMPKVNGVNGAVGRPCQPKDVAQAIMPVCFRE